MNAGTSFTKTGQTCVHNKAISLLMATKFDLVMVQLDKGPLFNATDSLTQK